MMTKKKYCVQFSAVAALAAFHFQFAWTKDENFLLLRFSSLKAISSDCGTNHLLSIDRVLSKKIVCQ